MQLRTVAQLWTSCILGSRKIAGVVKAFPQERLSEWLEDMDIPAPQVVEVIAIEVQNIPRCISTWPQGFASFSASCTVVVAF